MTPENPESADLFAGLGMTSMDQFACANREMFDSLMRQGFSERQAIQFCAEWSSRVAERGGEE